MKSLSSKLGVILIGLSIFGYVEVWGADWKYYRETVSGKLYYDVDSVTRSSGDIVRVWLKILYSKKGIDDAVKRSGEKYKTLSYSTNLKELHCRDKKFRILSIADYSKDENVLLSGDSPNLNWRSIPPGSASDQLYKILCK